MTETRKPFWIKCGACNHCWAGAYVPIELSKFVKLGKAARCPMCGEGKKLYPAKQDDGVLQEPADG